MKQQENWKSIQKREERKQRLSGQSSHGLQGGLRKAVIALVVVLVLAAVGYLVYAYVSDGYIESKTIVAKVNGQPVSLREANFFVGQTGSTFIGSGIFSPKNWPKMDEPAPFSSTPGETTRQFLKKYFETEYPKTMFLYDQALKDKLELSQQDKDAIETYFAQINGYAQQQGMTPAEFMSHLYGRGANKEFLTKEVHKTFLAEAFTRYKKASFKYDQAQLDKGYEENKDNVDLVNFHLYAFNINLKDYQGKDGKDKQGRTLDQALDAAKAAADKMLADIKGGMSFKEAVIKNGTPEEAAKAEKDGLDIGVARKQELSPEFVGFLFNKDRKKGDVEVIKREENGSQIILQFISREKPEDHPYTVRHILAAFNPEIKDEKAREADAEKRIEAIKKQYLDGQHTEDAFAALASTNSQDSGSRNKGGLYSDVKKGRMVESFEKWAQDPARKPGDIGIVKSSYGYHLMYFVKRDTLPAWESEVEKILRDRDYKAFLDAHKSEMTFEKTADWDKLLPLDENSKSTTVAGSSQAPAETSAPAETTKK